MSYSRWSTSLWYTYWNVSSGETKQEQVFTICGEASFTYEELVNDLDACIKKVSEGVSQADIFELKTYVFNFLEDVERKFPEPKVINV